MSDPHSTPSAHAPSSDDSGLIKTPTQLLVVVVLAFVVPIAAIFTIIHFVMADQPRAKSGSDKVVAERIKPVGSTPEIEKGPSPLVPVPVPVAAAPAADAAAPAAAGSNGKAVYDASCMACHGVGVAGAPKTGDKAAWAPRIGAGIAAMQTSAIKGKNAMPAKGGNLSLSDADVKAAVDYMVAQSK